MAPGDPAAIGDYDGGAADGRSSRRLSLAVKSRSCCLDLRFVSIYFVIDDGVLAAALSLVAIVTKRTTLIGVAVGDVDGRAHPLF
nr:hypothetical protein Itr_chr15CG09540 [Ipomoea trifida]